MEDAQHYQDGSYGGPADPWIDHQYYQPSQHSPLHEHPSYAYTSAPGMDSIFSAATSQSRPSHHQLQPIITTPWPSMLASQSTSYLSQNAHPLPPPLPPAQERSESQPVVSQPPALAPAYTPPHPTTTPRRTLTDNDRRKMCQYHEDNPTKKQTEIGEIFGVERSTVSKVLRQKDKYLLQEDDGSRSPTKKSKLKHPDIDRTLAKWVYNQTNKGVSLTDDQIREQAKLFWLASGNGSNCPPKIDSPRWLEKFKQTTNLPAPKRRKSSIKSPTSPEHDYLYSAEQLSRQASPVVSAVYTRPDANGSLEGLGIRGTRGPFYSQSNTSLSSAFTDGAPATFSSNTSTGSPVISPDAVSATSYFPAPLPYATPTTITPTSASPRQRPRQQRSRSSTFHTQQRHPPAPTDSYISPPYSADASSPHYPSSSGVLFDRIISAPIMTSDMHPPTTITSNRQYPAKPHATAPASSLHAKSMPSLKSRTSPKSHAKKRMSSTSDAPSITEARAGLELAIAFLRAQQSGVDDVDVAHIRRVLGKLQVEEPKSLPLPLPGGLHRIPEQEFGRWEGESEGEGGEVEHYRVQTVDEDEMEYMEAARKHYRDGNGNGRGGSIGWSMRG